MTWHGQINRTIWEIENLLEKQPRNFRLKRELIRTHFLQRYEYDRSLHVPRDDRSFLFLQDEPAPAVLLLHGAHGTPAEMRELGNFLYGKGQTVYCPRLSRYDLKNRRVTWESWVTMSENALTTLLQYSQRTTVVGLSLGGTIAVVLDRLQPIQSLVLLAPALHPRLGVRGWLVSLGRKLTPTLFNRFSGWNGEAIKAMEFVRKSEQQVRAPVLAIQARDDNVLSSKGLKLVRKWVTGEASDVVLLRHGSHALTRGPAKDEVFEKVFEFTKNVQPLREPSPPRPRQSSRQSSRRPPRRPPRRQGSGERATPSSPPGPDGAE